MKMTSVLLVTPGWTRDGGVATHVMASAAALAEHGLEVSVLAARVEPSALVPGITIFHSPELFNTLVPPSVRLGDALTSAPTAIHLHQFDDPQVTAVMREVAPVVVSAHGYTACTSGVHYFRPGQECARPHGLGCVPRLAVPGCAHTSDPRSLPEAYRRAGRGLDALRRADTAVSYSSAVDRHLSINGVTRRKLVPLFATLPPVEGSGHATRRRVVFAGRVVAPKGAEVLIRAACSVDAEFVICGDGWRLEETRRLAKRLGVQARVHFKGWLDAEALARELADASVVAVPSVWPEPFGLVGIEAFAAGRPVVASSTGGVGDWLQDGVNGLAVEPGDADALARALNELLEDPARQQRMGAAGREMAASHFSAERHVAALIEAYGDARARWESHADGKPSAPGDPRATAILCISPSFSPDTTPTAIRASKLLTYLSAEHELTVLTESPGAESLGAGRSDHVRVQAVRAWRPTRLLVALRRLRMNKLVELLVWPDESIFWVLPAILAARRVIRDIQPSAIVVFMMPYSGGLAGVALSRLSGLPLILNLDDSPTCTDMHPHFPTRLHYRLARALEDFYIRHADAVVYVSRTNLESVRSRQPEQARHKLQLVRYGADAADFRARPARTADFEIAYVGAMSGWWSLTGASAPAGALSRAYDAWTRLGRYERARLDQRTSSPAIVGRAILDAIAAHPDWAGRVRLSIYGNPYPASLVAESLSSAGVESVVSVFGPVAHGEVADIVASADLLFLTLPKRLDGSPGGRISAKTYEYLATDRPILAAVPRGENWDYLADKPGVWLVEPDDHERMKEVIVELAAAKLAGRASTFDRADLHAELSYETRAREFDAVIRAGIERRLGRDRAPRS